MAIDAQKLRDLIRRACPLPWILATSNSWRRIVSERDGTTVCEPITQPDGHPDLYFPNGGADGPDAHILAASRDMYEALKSIVEDHDFCGDDWGDRRDAWIETARAALAKAEGKS